MGTVWEGWRGRESLYDKKTWQILPRPHQLYMIVYEKNVTLSMWLQVIDGDCMNPCIAWVLTILSVFSIYLDHLFILYVFMDIYFIILITIQYYIITLSNFSFSAIKSSQLTLISWHTSIVLLSFYLL